MHHLEHCKRSTCVLPIRPKASWDSFACKRCSQRQHLLDNVHNSQARHPTRSSKCTISSPVRARSGAPTPSTSHNRKNATRTRVFNTNTQRRITGPLCTHQKVCAQITMWHLKNLLAERPTSCPSKCIILSVTRVVSGASTHTRTETLRSMLKAFDILLPRPNTFLDPFALKKCSQHTVPPRARASLG